MSRGISRRLSKVSVIAYFAMMLLGGCVATLKESYYLAAHDPDTQSTNYFRITLKGDTSFSSAKFSVGFYDRNAVERLFGETALEREYLATKIELFGQDGKRLRDLAAQLAAANTAEQSLRKDRLDQANSALSELIGKYRFRLASMGELLQRFGPPLDRASTLQREGEAFLKSNPSDLISASARLREAQGYLEAIRVAVDGRVLVRFFDGAGNEIDVANKTQVVFVASDASRFFEALRQLAESEAASEDMLKIALGPQIKEARWLAARAASSDSETSITQQELKAIQAELTSATNIALVKKEILRAASAASGASIEFKDQGNIRDFLRGATEP